MADKGIWQSRRETFAQLEEELNRLVPKKEDRLFYYHSSEDRIVLSHALFWVMSGSLKGKVIKERYFLLLREYQEKMLDAYLMDNEDFAKWLHYCTVLYEMLPFLLRGTHDIFAEKDTKKLAGICIVASGYAGDMPEDLCYELLDDMDFVYNKVKCRKIEKMIPQLRKMVDEELKEVK